MTTLVTGTAGFIFSHYVRAGDPSEFVGVDKLVRESNARNMYDAPGYRFHIADIADAHAMDRIFAKEKPEIVIGGAAESFVDDAITDIMPFLRTNIIGTQTLINACLKHGVWRYVHISTDEVYGQHFGLGHGWTEDQPLAPRNPYAASKACGEHIVRSAHETHGLEYQIIRSCNVYGPRQKRENLVPHIVTSILEGKRPRIHGDGHNFRQYIHVNDEIAAINWVTKRGEVNAVYNIGGEDTRTNTEMVYLVAGLMNASPAWDSIPDRKAHDFGYVVSSEKLRALRWQPTVPLRAGMIETIEAIRRGGVL